MLCIADPHLGPVDDVVVLVFLRTRLQRKRVAARLRLREAEAAHLFLYQRVAFVVNNSTAWNFCFLP